MLNSFSSLLTLLLGLMIFIGACYLMATKRRPAVLAAYLVLLPLPLLINLCGWLKGLISSLEAIATLPNVAVTTADLAAATADSLLGLLVALLVSAPSYFVLAVGLLLRTWRSPDDSTGPASIGSQRPAPLLSSAGSLPAMS